LRRGSKLCLEMNGLPNTFFGSTARYVSPNQHLILQNGRDVYSLKAPSRYNSRLYTGNRRSYAELGSQKKLVLCPSITELHKRQRLHLWCIVQICCWKWRDLTSFSFLPPPPGTLIPSYGWPVRPETDLGFGERCVIHQGAEGIWGGTITANNFESILNPKMRTKMWLWRKKFCTRIVSVRTAQLAVAHDVPTVKGSGRVFISITFLKLQVNYMFYINY
jgi:hypothetical protein